MTNLQMQYFGPTLVVDGSTYLLAEVAEGYCTRPVFVWGDVVIVQDSGSERLNIELAKVAIRGHRRKT